MILVIRFPELLRASSTRISSSETAVSSSLMVSSAPSSSPITFLAVNTQVPSRMLSPTLWMVAYDVGSADAVLPSCVQTSVTHPGAALTSAVSPTAYTVSRSRVFPFPPPPPAPPASLEKVWVRLLMPELVTEKAASCRSNEELL